MAEGEVLEVEGVEEDVEYTDDGGAIVKVGPDDEDRPNREFYDNIADDLDDGTPSKVCEENNGCPVCAFANITQHAADLMAMKFLEAH